MNTQNALRTVETYDPSDGSSFQRTLQNVALVLGFTDLEFARMFDVSRPSVTRWRNGETTPQLAIRKVVKREMTTQGGICTLEPLR